MAKKNFMAQLQKLHGAIIDRYNPHSDVLETPSPSANFIYGNAWGLPKGYTQVLYGPPKGGKSLYSNAMIGWLHRNDPDAFAVKFDTEFRDRGQNTDGMMTLWGIDPNRYIAIEANNPEHIFDQIEKDLAAMCEDGMKLGLVVIDSITGVQGRRTLNSDTVMQQQIGDEAKTIQDGLKRILEVQRKYRFALILVTQQRSELDQREIQRGNTVKMAGPWYLKHYAEYFTYVEPFNTKDGKTDLLGNKFEDDTFTDLMDNGDRTGHKIRVIMKDSSMGPKGRVGVFTLDYKRGIVNTHEEVFLLGVNRGVIERPNNVMFAYKGKQWRGKEAMLEALKDPVLAKQILTELKERDLAGLFTEADLKAARIVEEQVKQEQE